MSAMWYALTGLVVAISILALGWRRWRERLRLMLISRRIRKKYGLSHFEIAPSGVLRKKYGLYAENRPIIQIHPANVPAHLHDLIPMAEKWGISDDIIRSDF